MKNVLLIIIALAINVGICSAQVCHLHASITAGPGDTKQDCTVTYTGTCSGGTAPLDYEWSSSVDPSVGSGTSVDADATDLGPGVMTLTVTDADGHTSTATRNYTIHKEVETTGSCSSGGTPGTLTPSNPYVTASQTNSSSSTETLTYTVTVAASVSEGLTVTGTVDEGVVKTSVAATSTVTATATTGETHSFNVAPGQTAAVCWQSYVVQYTGTWTKYDCTGKIDNGTWTDYTPDSSKPAGGNYYLQSVT